MKNKIFMLLTIMAIGMSCNEKNHIKNFEILLKNDFTQSKLEEINFVIVIPNQGCGGCITFAENFYSLNKGRNNIIFIFTNIISMKNLKYRVDINTNTTFLDTENKYLHAYPKDKQIYPCILKIKEGRIVQMKFQSSSENYLN